MTEYASKGKHFGSIAKRRGMCKCGAKGAYGYWGKYYCKPCYIKKFGKDPDKIAKSGGKGHGGLVGFKTEQEFQEALNQFIPLNVQATLHLHKVPKGNKLFAHLYLSHYPNSKGIVGRSINYLILYEGKVVGIIGGSSPPYSVAGINNFFGITKENRSDMLIQIMNNDVFRLIVRKPNLATRVLRVFRFTLQKDHINKYSHPLIGLITFVEPPRTGIIYKADNWDYLGMTKGYGTIRRGKRWHHGEWVKKQPKHIFGYKFSA